MQLGDSSGFGRNVARYIACRLDNPPVLWEELFVGGVDESWTGAVMSRKRENISQDAPDGQEPDHKRLRYASKRPPRGEHGCAVNGFWDGIFSQIDTKIPRVGKRIFTHGDELKEVQRSITGVKILRMEACRGTERLRILDSSVNQRDSHSDHCDQRSDNRQGWSPWTTWVDSPPKIQTS